MHFGPTDPLCARTGIKTIGHKSRSAQGMLFIRTHPPDPRRHSAQAHPPKRDPLRAGQGLCSQAPLSGTMCSRRGVGDFIDPSIHTLPLLSYASRSPPYSSSVCWPPCAHRCACDTRVAEGQEGRDVVWDSGWLLAWLPQTS